MAYLLDTNIISEIRKSKSRINVKVADWYESVESESLWLSVLVLGEIRQGIELRRKNDPVAASHLETWLEGLEELFSERILPITTNIAQRWGVINAAQPVAYIDGLLAATAIEHHLVLVTRNVADIHTTGVSYLNPFT